MDKPFPAYQGTDPYVFVCYAHDDNDVVYPEITWLRDQGINIWYDEGIEVGTEWREELANAITESSLFLYFVTPESAQSQNCRKEVNFAIDQDIPIIAVHLEKTDLSGGLNLSLSDRQAILKHEVSDQEYRKKLLNRLSNNLEQSSIRPSISVKGNGGKRILLAISIALLAFGSIYLLYDQVSTDGEKPARTSNPVVAVLPFINMSSDTEREYLVDGMTEDIITLLAQSPGVEVVARNSTFKYKGQHPDIREVGKDLGADYVVEGSLRSVGERIRVTVQVIDSGTGAHVWAEQYDRAMSDFFDVQDDVTLGIAAAVGDAIFRKEYKQFNQSRTENLTAYALTLRADVGFSQAMGSDRWIQRAREAVEADPQYALAHAVLARHLVAWGLFGNGTQADIVEAEEAARYAATLSPNDPKVLAYLGITLLWSGKPEAALLIAQRVVEISPSYAEGIAYLGDILIHNGRSQEGLVHINNAIRLTPNAPQLLFYFVLKGEALLHHGEFARAEEVLMEVSRLGRSTHPYLAGVQLKLDRLDEAKETLRRVLESDLFTSVADLASDMAYYSTDDGGVHFLDIWKRLEALETELAHENVQP